MSTHRSGTAAPTPALEVGGVRLYADRDEAGLFWCVPSAPAPEADDNGVPAVSLILLGQRSILNVGATLAVPESALQQAAAAARASNDAAHQEDVQLRLAPMTVTSAALEAIDGGAHRRAIATSTSSGFAPFNAVFSAELDEATTAAATAALRGGTGHLFVTYHAEVSLGTARPFALTLAADVASWFSNRPKPQFIVVPQPTNPSDQ